METTLPILYNNWRKYLFCDSSYIPLCLEINNLWQKSSNILLLLLLLSLSLSLNISLNVRIEKKYFFFHLFFLSFFFFLSNKNDVSPIIFNKYQTQHYILNSVKFFSTTYIYIYTYTKYWYNRVIFLKYYRDWSKYINKMSVKVKIEHNNNETKTEWISVSFHLTIFNL